MHLREAFDRERKRRHWRGERIGWGALAVFVLVAASGFFGSGPVAWQDEVRTADGARYTLDYEVWNRYHATTLFVVRVEAPATDGDTLRVAFGPPFADGATVRSSAPPADGGEVGPEGQVYVFAVDDWSAPLVVSFEVLPERIGVWSTELTVQAGEREAVVVPFDQRIFP